MTIIERLRGEGNRGYGGWLFEEAATAIESLTLANKALREALERIQVKARELGTGIVCHQTMYDVHEIACQALSSPPPSPTAEKEQPNAKTS